VLEKVEALTKTVERLQERVERLEDLPNFPGHPLARPRNRLQTVRIGRQTAFRAKLFSILYMCKICTHPL
jgi:hypothetical protein